jgi:hypothetical protein
MIPTSLEKLGRPAQLPRDAYEATEEGTARPIVRATLTMALVSALSLMKDLLYGKKAEAFTPSTDEPEPESVEAAIESANPTKAAAVTDPEQELHVEDEEESVELSSATIDTAAIRGSSRLVYFATGDSLELGQLGYAAPGPLGKPRRPVNDNAVAGVDDAGEGGSLRRVSNLGSSSGGSGGSGGGADDEAPDTDSDTGSGPGPDDVDDEGSDGDSESRPNRAPSVAGNLALRDVFIN